MCWSIVAEMIVAVVRYLFAGVVDDAFDCVIYDFACFVFREKRDPKMKILIIKTFSEWTILIRRLNRYARVIRITIRL